MNGGDAFTNATTMRCVIARMRRPPRVAPPIAAVVHSGVGAAEVVVVWGGGMRECDDKEFSLRS